MHMHHENLTNTTGYQESVKTMQRAKIKDMEIGRKAGGVVFIEYDFLYSSDLQNQVNISYFQKKFVCNKGKGWWWNTNRSK